MLEVGVCFDVEMMAKMDGARAMMLRLLDLDGGDHVGSSRLWDAAEVVGGRLEWLRRRDGNGDGVGEEDNAIFFEGFAAIWISLEGILQR